MKSQSCTRTQQPRSIITACHPDLSSMINALTPSLFTFLALLIQPCSSVVSLVPYKALPLAIKSVDDLRWAAISARGGLRKETSVEGRGSKISELLNRVLPATRAYLLLITTCTIVHLTGLPAPVWFGLDIRRYKWLQVWRPFTSMAYFGTPSMSMATSVYFLLNYGQRLEENIGSVEQAWLMLVQTAILSIFGVLLRFPFQSKAFVTALVYCSSRRNSFDLM